MQPEISIAPTPELIRYLALFRRTFLAMQKYVEEQDEDGILLMAWTADALHNIPGMLWRYPPQESTDAYPVANMQRLTTWVNNFPQVVTKCAPPDHIIAACESIFSPKGTAAELALSEDLSDLDLAPSHQIAAHVDLFYSACLAFRWRQGTHWREFDEHWQEARIGKILIIGKMANDSILKCDGYSAY